MAKKRSAGRKTSTNRRKTKKNASVGSRKSFERRVAAGNSGLEVEEAVSAESAEEPEDMDEGAFGQGASRY